MLPYFSWFLNVFAETVVQTLLVLTVLSPFGVYWLRRRHYAKWQKKVFEHRIHFGTNTIQVTQGANPEWRLVFDSLFEDVLSDVIDDPIARDLIEASIKRTTEKDPFLAFHPNDRWYVMGAIKTAIAECFQAGTLAKLAGLPHRSVDCIFAITFERYPEMRSRKLRVIMVRSAMFTEEKTDLDRTDIKCERKHQSCRIDTLRDMRDDWRAGKRVFTESIRINIATEAGR